ncbi:threonine dehydrogenase-like Zn-dependent dehydrogenase [Paraburkholderia sp. 40]
MLRGGKEKVVGRNASDAVSVPFNVACGRCPTCKAQHTGVCLNVNPSRAGGAYGYVDMGGWIGGQAEYVLVPYADFNLLKFPDHAQALAKIRDLTCLSDILPTGYHGAVMAGVKPGATVYIAGAGPVGMAAAASARLLGAACTIVGDMNEARLAHARKMGFQTINLSKDATLGEQIEQILGKPEVDCAVDCVGFEAHGHGSSGSHEEAPASVLNSLMEITRAAGAIGIPRTLRDRRSGLDRCRRASGQPQLAFRARLGQVAFVSYRADAGDEVQPRSDAGDTLGSFADRRYRQRDGGVARRCARGLPAIRRRRAEEVCDRPARVVEGGLSLVGR